MNLRVLPLGLGIWVLGLGVSNAQDAPYARLQAWVAAVDRHVAGDVDAPVSDVRTWSRTDLVEIRTHLPTLVRLVRDPDANFYYYTPLEVRPGSGREQVPYRPQERDALRSIARAAAKSGDANRLLKRGAMLHADIGFRAPPDSSVSRTDRGSTTLLTRRVLMSDGTSRGILETVDHWAMARAVLDMVAAERPDRSDPARDAFVRAWYRAFAAAMLDLGWVVVPHFRRGLDLFPDDPVFLRLAGAMHERMSAPVVQGADPYVRPERDELADAATMFRRALAVDPAMVEARLRHGLVLTRLGHHAYALEELTVAAQVVSDGELRYYTTLFLGIAAEQTGDVALARRSYESAAALYPDAQSPRLALSQLAHRLGDRQAAVGAVTAVVSRVDEAGASPDPWWTYLTFAGRDAKARIAELNRMVPR